MSVTEQLLEIFKYGVSSVQPNNILDNFIKVQNKKIIVKEGSKQKIYSQIKKSFSNMYWKSLC